MHSLPVLPSRERSRIKRSRSSRWRAGVLITIHVAIALHITYWLLRGATISPVEPSEAIAFSRSGVVNAGLIFFAATVALTVIFGRFFCGWACHLVALQDLCRWLLEKFGRRPAPLRARFLGWVPAVSFLYLFGLPLYSRLSGGDPLFSGPTELVTTDFWSRFPGWSLALLTFFVCGFAIIYFLGAKGFCTYACPYGAAFAAAERLAPLRIRVTNDCEGCGHCTAVCTSNIRVHQEVRDFGMVTSSGCMKCLDCVSVCPNDALYYGSGTLPLFAKRRTKTPARPTKRYSLATWEEILLAGGGVAGYLTFRGLYGAVPILLALGLAAIFAYLLLLAARLLVQPHVAFKGWRLKTSGRLTRHGWQAAGLLVIVLAFWSHSAWMRWTLRMAEKGYASAYSLRQQAFDLSTPLRNEMPKQIGRTLAHYRTLDRYGLFPTFGTLARQASLSLAVGNTRDALEFANESLRHHELPIDAHMVLATAAALTGDLKTALQSYSEVVAASPQNAQAAINLGLVLAESGRFSEAARVFRKALATFPDSAPLHYNAGLALALAGRLEEAVKSFERSLELDPDNLPAAENLAGTLAQLGQFERAQQVLQDHVAREPRTPTRHQQGPPSDQR